MPKARSAEDCVGEETPSEGEVVLTVAKKDGLRRKVRQGKLSGPVNLMQRVIRFPLCDKSERESISIHARANYLTICGTAGLLRFLSCST